ncbi:MULTISPECIES: substrate-binding domain-containing protein [Microbacterium]|uniref:substrate-binding domain-containing protein n=1 Tax=Microbacterium TaxID=33882 RepID=UPI002789F98A|nr:MULTISPECIES: substrate-binding domain-containing protein [Microbacterium]MDQ1076392.1 putative multiple sugar transport system substrate-binding protein [Microbacterium sp. SORGH_AS_0969]MDQ1116629.1 putative multiple sugar transport system substrate-binding protein [Microbacterium testaceum]
MTPRTPLRRAAAVLAVVALGLAGCTATPPREGGSSDGAGVIGVALPSTADAGWEHAGEVVASELRDRGYRVDLEYAADDARTQASQVQNMLTKGMDAVIVAPLSTEELAAPAELAEEDGVPIALLGRGLPVSGAGFAAVVEPEELGRAQAQALLDALDAVQGTDATDPTPTPDSDAPDSDASETDASADPAPASPAGPVELTVLAGAADDAWEQRRFAAAREALASAVDEGRVVITSGATWDDAAVADDPLDVSDAAEKRARVVVAVTDADGETPGRPAFLALGDDVTRGVVTALTTDPPAGETPSPTPSPSRAAERPDPIVVGSGADLATARALDAGVVAATVFVDTRDLAAPIADAIEALLDEREPVSDGTEIPGLTDAPAVAVGPQTVRADDITRVLLDTGWLTPEELSG